MQGPMPHGRENPFPLRHSGKKQAGEQIGVSGHGVMSSSSGDVIPENSGLGPHQRSISSTQGSAHMGATTCAVMYGRCAKANGKGDLFPCGEAAF